jgi:hypothetical protein
MVGDARLDGDQAHRMGHHVVQLAGDTQALFAHGPLGQALGLRPQVGTSIPHRLPDGPRSRHGCHADDDRRPRA